MPARILPEGRNPQLEEDNAPPYNLLVERRCLGQTELKVKPGQVGTTNATNPHNLGVMDYAHLRVSLPKDLSGSQIFKPQSNRKWPEAYFLMRRSTDGFISATGMFKAAFPWATQDEETAEKEYIKDLDATSREEVAGNVWVHPDQAVELAEEYGIRMWIEALLDPEPITHGTSDPKKQIKSPPSYRVKDMMNGAGKKAGGGKKRAATPATEARRSTRGGSAKPEEMSPVKKGARKIATPKKTPARKTRGKSADPETALNGETVKVEVESKAQLDESGEDEVERTKVNVEMPSGHPDLDMPEDAEGMLAKAREMVSEAEKMDGRSGKAGKRKAGDMVDAEEVAAPAVKRARKAELDVRRERIRRRALTGIAASLAIGALVPGIMTVFGS